MYNCHHFALRPLTGAGHRGDPRTAAARPRGAGGSDREKVSGRFVAYLNRLEGAAPSCLFGDSERAIWRISISVAWEIEIRRLL